MTLNLGDLKYHVQTQKKKRGIEKPVGPEDQFMMGQI